LAPNHHSRGPIGKVGPTSCLSRIQTSCRRLPVGHVPLRREQHHRRDELASSSSLSGNSLPLCFPSSRLPSTPVTDTSKHSLLLAAEPPPRLHISALLKTYKSHLYQASLHHYARFPHPLPSRLGTRPRRASKATVVHHRCRPKFKTSCHLLSSVRTALTSSMSPRAAVASSVTTMPPGPQWTMGRDSPVVHNILSLAHDLCQLKNNPETG
jgi:hypothetical protein